MANVWDDVDFSWDLRGSDLPSKNEVDAQQNSGTTEGTWVTSPRDGREYTTGRGSRFDYAAMVSATPMVDGMTLMAVFRQPTSGEDAVLFWGDSSETAYYSQIDIRDAGVSTFQVRSGGGTPDDDNFINTIYDSGSHDTDLHVVVGRRTYPGTPNPTSVVAEIWYDGVLQATQTHDMVDTKTYNRLTVGRNDDGSTGGADGGGIHQAAMWMRALTDLEITDLSADPYSYPDLPNPTPTTVANLVAVAGDSEVDLAWDENLDADLVSYNIFRQTSSPVLLVTPLDNVLAGTEVYNDATAVNDTEYFYAVTAVNDVPNESLGSNEDSATPEAAAAGGSRAQGAGMVGTVLITGGV